MAKRNAFPQQKDLSSLADIMRQNALASHAIRPNVALLPPRPAPVKKSKR